MRRRKSGSCDGCIPYFCCLLLLSCMVITPVICDEEWSSPYFLAGPPVKGVQFNEDSSQGKFGVVNVDENLSQVVIAKFSYKGATAPTCIEGCSSFKVNQSEADENWLINLIQPQDYEASDDKRRQVIYQIGSETGTLWVIVNNLNDNVPVVEYLGPEKCMVDENFAGVSNCTIKVTDEDGVKDVIVSSKTSGFSLIKTSSDEKSAEFLLNVDDELDYEKIPLRSTTIVANDNFMGVTFNAETLLVVWVNDLPDTDPTWQNVFSSQRINEKEQWEYTFLAQDGDLAINASISYKLVMENKEDEKYFHIDENSGIFSVEEINRDVLQVETYKMKVIAYETDDPNSNVDASITILVDDINDNIPQISPLSQTIAIDEETSMTLEFTKPFSVTDRDLGVNAQFKLELEENDWSSAFLLIPDAGYQTANISISVVNPSALDYEDPAWREISLTMIATEQKDPKHTSSATISISLLNRNDESPVFDLELYEASVLEDEQIGYIITTVNARDPDEGDTVTYSLTQRVLMINENTGKVTVSAENAFDYERQQNMMVQVIATDEVNHRSYTQINITIVDVNDEAPTLYLPREQLEIEEHLENDFELPAIINATDPDSDCNLEFSIDWEKSYATKQGRRITDSTLFAEVMRIEGKKLDDTEWQANLVVNNKALLDWEEFDTLYLIIAVNDTNTDPKYMANFGVKSGTLPLTILDINDNPPVFTESSTNANWSVEENSNPNKLIGRAIATDRDSEENGNITYKIEPVGIPAGMVIIDEISGEIQTGKVKIDYEDYDQHSYIIHASDGEHNASLNIIIYIEDQNDNNPIIIETEDGNTIYIPENTVSQNITIINATDADTFWKYRTLTYMFYNERDENMLNFQIANDTGLVSVNSDANLDRETQSSYSLTFYVRDNYMDGIKVGSLSSNPTTINVILTDENDERPEFKDLSECYISALENHTVGESIFTGVLAEDKDEPGNVNSQFEYFLESDEENLFSVETVNPETWIINITTNQSLIDKYGKYNVTIGAVDHGIPPLENFKSYIICIIDLNDNAPVMTYPEEDMSLYLHSTQKLYERLKDRNNYPIQDFQATDADDSNTDNGLVTFSILGSNETLKYFKLINQPGTARLVLYNEPPSTENIFELTLIASDNGEPKLSSETRTIKIVIVNMDDIPPKFEIKTQVMTIPENTIDFSQNIYEAEDANNKGLEEDDKYWQKTLYDITDGNKEDRFKLNRSTGELTLTKELDYEHQKSYLLTIQAHTYGVLTNPHKDSLLHLTIQVEDVNDLPPRFDYALFTGTFSTTDKYDKEVASLQASDNDTMDTQDKLTYKIIPDSMTVSHDSLISIQNTAFNMEGNTTKLAITPSGNLQGYFHFKVEVRDSMSPPNEYHMDTAEVKVYVISSSNIVKFNFWNSREEVEQKKNDINFIFGNILQCVCVVDTVDKALNKNGKPLDNETIVDAHFVDDGSDQPIESDKIIQKVIDNSVYRKLRNALSVKQLDLVNFVADNADSGNSIQDYLQTILICVSAVLGVMVLVLFVAFFVRTRTLNKRLEKLSTTKFGSQDSGLNRVGIAVPNTNRHAVEGSNPVWNEDVVPDYDNMSQGSGDSDLIGIEDSPEFNPHYNGASDGVTNGSYAPDHEVGFERRASVNPLSNLTGDSGVRRASMNPLSSSFDNISNNDHMTSNSNFIFRRPDSVPATEL